MPTAGRTLPALNPPVRTKVLKFMTDHEVPPNTGTSMFPYKSVDGFRYLNVFVRYNQMAVDEAPVDLGLKFAFSAAGSMGARRYVNLDENLSGPQSSHFIEVSGRDCWHGSPHNISSYVVRCPVMGPFAQVFVYNQAPLKRIVSVWAYLVA